MYNVLSIASITGADVSSWFLVLRFVQDLLMVVLTGGLLEICELASSSKHIEDSIIVEGGGRVKCYALDFCDVPNEGL